LDDVPSIRETFLLVAAIGVAEEAIDEEVVLGDRATRGPTERPNRRHTAGR
jgi:hypothetical protein